MREGLSAGKHVVRLKIGDPFIFGRGAEEVLEMRRLGIEPKVVPGISSVFAAPLLGGVPATHRGVATQVRSKNVHERDVWQYKAVSLLSMSCIKDAWFEGVTALDGKLGRAI